MIYNFIRKNNAVLIWSTIILNVLSISIGIYVLVLLLTNKPVEIELNFNAVLGSFIGICTTFVVGFQIWNYIYYTQKLDTLDIEKDILRKKIEELENSKTVSMYFSAYTIGRMRYQMAEGFNPRENDKKYYWNALRGLSNALRYAAKGGHDFDDTYQSIHEKIFTAIDQIVKDVNHLVFDTNKKVIRELAFEIDGHLKEIEKHLHSSIKLETKYHDFIRYSDIWHQFLENNYAK